MSTADEIRQMKPNENTLDWLRHALKQAQSDLAHYEQIPFAPIDIHRAQVEAFEDAIHVVTAYAALVEQTTWQPMETAPKDGTFVLLVIDGWSVPTVGHWFRYHDEYGDGWWVVNAIRRIPTGWMPLPPLPAPPTPAKEHT